MQQIIIIGGGAAGFFAAIHLAEQAPQAAITLLERGKSVLEKVRISGGGRCNVTHACWDPRELVKHYPRGSRELLGPFNRFACGDTMAWFEDRGVPLKIEEDGRVFPTSNQSASIIDCLWNMAKKRGVKVVTRCRVEGLKYQPEEQGARWLVKAGDQQLPADRVVVTTGSNPSVWKWLRNLGLAVTDPVPSLFAFNIPDKRLQSLMGISLPWAAVKVLDTKLNAEGPLLITHKGLSGPAILRLSAWGARILAPRKYNFQLAVNWINTAPDDVVTALQNYAAAHPKKQVGTIGQLDLPLRLWRFLVEKSGLPLDKPWNQLQKKHYLSLATAITDSRFTVNGKATNKEEFVTAGGVNLKEVDFKHFTAKKFPSLHLAGEVLDIDAITGGFNFQAAWTGGWSIGQVPLAT